MRPPVSKPFLAIGMVRAIALILIAWGLSTGITSIIEAPGTPANAIWIAFAGVLLRALTDWLSAVIAQRSSTLEKKRLRDAMVTRVLRRGGRDINLPEGELTWMATSGLEGLDAWYSQYLPAVSQAMVIPVIIGLVIGVTDWVSGVILILTLPLVPLFMWLIGTYTEDRVARSTAAVASLSGQLVELARGLPVLVGLHRADEQAEALRRITDNVRQRTMQSLRTVFLSALALELIATISVAVVAVFVGIRLIWGDISLLDGLFVLLLAPECFTPLRQVGGAFHAAEEGADVAERVRAVVDDGALPPATGDRVQIESLEVRYRNRALPAVSGFDLRLSIGETVALSGPSGCGKSSILAAIAGQLTDGEQQEVRGTIRSFPSERLAYLAQHPSLVADTPKAELELALEGEGDPYDLLQRVGLQHLADRNAAELSIGEIRRLAFARVLARVERGAKLVLLDEPVAHLDPANARLVRQEVQGLKGKVALLLVAHDAATRELADRVVELGDAEDESPSLTEESPMRVAPGDIGDLSTDNADLSEVLDLVQPRRRGFVLALVFGIAAALSAVALSSLSGWLIVRASEQPPIMYLLVAIVGVRFFGIGRAVFRYVERLTMHDAILASMSDLRLRVWHSLSQAGPRSARWLRPGATMKAMIDAVDTVRDLAPRVMMPAVVVPGTVVIASLIVAAIDCRSGLVVVLAAGAALVIAPIITIRLDAAAASREGEIRNLLTSTVGNVITAAPDIHGNGLGDRVRATIANLDARLAAAADRGALGAGAGNAAVTLIVGACSAMMLAIGDGAVWERDLAPALLAVVVLTPLALIEPVTDLVPAARQWPELSRSGGIVQGIIADESVVETRSREPIESIAVENLSATWPGRDSMVLNDLSFQARRGDWLVVTGPSGIGKSTLFSVLMGFLAPASGNVSFNRGTRLGKHARVAWTPQEAHIFDSTIRGNLLLARSREQAPSDSDMIDALGTVGLGDLLLELPDGLQTNVGPAGRFLSGGQRTRLSIARAILADADVILLDEPTAHLDRASARSLLRALRHSLSDRIVIVITHHQEDIAPTDTHIQPGAM